MTNQLKSIKKEFENAANPEKSVSMKKYMLNQFEYYGVMAPERRLIQKKHLLKYGKYSLDELKQMVILLWNEPYRELQYFALDLLSKNSKLISVDWIDFYEELALNNSWWDTIDTISGILLGDFFMIYPNLVNKYTSKWLKSNNIWLQRCTILFQLKYKLKTDTVLLSKIINKLSDSNEFFIQKAIGWVLREYAKTNPQFVVEFVKNNKLAPLSRREALRIIIKNE